MSEPLSMRERIARAMVPSLWNASAVGPYYDQRRAKAFAAADAVLEEMRSPTEAMLHAAQRAWTPGVSTLEAHAIRYASMIDAAIKEGKE